MEPENSLKIDLNEPGNGLYVLIQLFLDSMRKFGKHKAVKSMSYNVNGLTVVDEDDVVWSLEVNSKVTFPKYLNDLPNSRTQDPDTKIFCTECDAGMTQEFEVCSVCEYLRKI